MRRVLAMGVALGLCSCSFLVVDRPRPLPNPPHCTESYLAPGTDTAFAAVALAYLGLGLIIVYAFKQPGSPVTLGEGARTFGVIAGTGALATSSAIYGYWETDQCTAAMMRYRRAQADDLIPRGQAAAAKGQCATALEVHQRLVALRPASAAEYLEDISTEHCVVPERTRQRPVYQRTSLASRLAHLADAAANAGDCVTVKTLLGRVQSLGVQVSSITVEVEATLQRCVAAHSSLSND